MTKKDIPMSFLYLDKLPIIQHLRYISIKFVQDETKLRQQYKIKEFSLNIFVVCVLLFIHMETGHVQRASWAQGMKLDNFQYVFNNIL